jgi:hypothetical protein
VLRCVQELRTWKSGEDAASCADVSAAAEAYGLFALADGVSRSPYPELWARALVEQFCSAPLLSTDPYELRWWLSQAARRRAALLPSVADARSVSAATLVTARVLDAAAAGLRIELLAIGDACALWQLPNESTFAAFPLTTPAAFDADPAVLCSDDAVQPAVAARFCRHQVVLPHGTLLVLASDALAAFLLQPSTADLRQLRDCDPADWAGLVRRWRRALPPLADDDTSALILQVDVAADARIAALDELPAVRQRVAEATDAAGSAQWRRFADLYGDGLLLRAAGLRFDDTLIRHARAVAAAFDALRAAFSSWLAGRHSPAEARQAAEVQELLARDAALLLADPSAQTLLSSLAGFGFVVPHAAATTPLTAAVTQPLSAVPPDGEDG